MAKLTFGKHKGTDVNDLPTEYLEWGVANLDSPRWKAEFEEELGLRREAEKIEWERLKAHIDDPSTLDFLIKKHTKEIELEIANSGCEWEYDNFNIGQEAEDRANLEIEQLQVEIAVDNLKKEFQGREGLTPELLKKIEDTYYICGCKLKRNQFSSKSRYQTACEYMQKLEKTRGY